jgi:flavin-dependent dehydrogenase
VQSEPSMHEIVIVGGGPAGAVCAETLARAGASVTLIDDHLAWEKPCGGGLTRKAIRAYPFLLGGPHPKKNVSEVELIAGSQSASPSGSPSSAEARANFRLNEPLVIYSRRVLNGLLLDRAERAGCRIVCARATAVAVDSPRPRVVAGSAEFSADFIVIAAGARNRFRPGSSPLEPADFEQTLGYFVPIQSDILKIKFIPGFPGYLWSFPRPDHLSVGICGKLDSISTAELRMHLDNFVREERLSHPDSSMFSHLLPSPRAVTIRSRAIVGKNWALVGDAAATVDTITGEGLYYAMRSGQLLGEALAAGRPERYPSRLRSECGAELERSAGLASRFFLENFFGQPVTRRMVQLARRSPTYRRLLGDLFSGGQNYRTLQFRFWAQLPLAVAESAWSHLTSSRSQANRP